MKILKQIKKILPIILIFNLLIYLIGAFITFDFNPMNWLAMTTEPGRTLLTILEAATIGLTAIQKFGQKV